MKEKGNFWQRFLAYLIDTAIVGIIGSIITSFSFLTVNEEKIKKIDDNYNALLTEYMEGKASMDEYLEGSKDYTYQVSKYNYNTNLINVVMLFGYFTIYQFLAKGKTLGKKLMKIRVVRDDFKDVSPYQIVVRSLLINSIWSSLVCLIGILFLAKGDYFILSMTISTLSSLFVIVSGLMVLYRSDKRSLHDMITKTIVIREK